MSTEGLVGKTDKNLPKVEQKGKNMENKEEKTEKWEAVCKP